MITGLIHKRTQIDPITCIHCVNCPAKLYVKNNISLGFGNLYADKIIIVPTYSLDYKKTGNYISAIKILQDRIPNLNENYYITRDAKCYVPQYDINNDIGKYCSWILSRELSRLQAHYIFAFGDEDLSCINKLILNSFFCKHTQRNGNNEVSINPAANPSKPSVKLTELDIPTTIRTINKI